LNKGNGPALDSNPAEFGSFVERGRRCPNTSAAEAAVLTFANEPAASGTRSGFGGSAVSREPRSRTSPRRLPVLRRLLAKLRLRVNEAKSAVAPATQRKFLGFSFWVAQGRVVKRRVAPHALARMKERDRQLTRRSAGRSLAAVCKELGVYLAGWKAYFRLAEMPRALADIDQWIRHRLRALQLKHWKRGRTIYRELRARGMSNHTAAQVAANGRRWWSNSAMVIHIALPNALFDKLGVPRLAS